MGCFQLAYGAALDLVTIAVQASGYRIQARAGHHQLTFEAAAQAMGDAASGAIEFFELCRRRRNAIAYEGDDVGPALAKELLQEANRFLLKLEAWMKRHHPQLL